MPLNRDFERLGTCVNLCFQKLPEVLHKDPMSILCGADLQRHLIHPWHLRRAVSILRQGGIIAYPTESVFGLGCNPLDRNAVMRLLAIKRRKVGKGLILICDQFERLRPFLAPLPEEILQRVRATWPGPVTWVLPAARGLPPWIRGNRNSVAVRVTAHPLAAALCRSAGMPLISTSANLSRRPPARNPLQVRIRCGKGIALVIHGATGGLATPTTIRDALSDTTLRL